MDFLSYIHHLEKPDAPMSFSGSSLKSPVKGDSSLLNSSDGGGDVRVADQDDFEVNLDSSAQVFDSDSPSSCLLVASLQSLTRPIVQPILTLRTPPRKIRTPLPLRLSRTVGGRALRHV